MTDRLLAASRRPVVAAKLVDDRTADPDPCVRGEHLGAGVCARPERVEEAQRAGRDEVVALHASGEPAHEVRDDPMHERHVLSDVLVGRCRVGSGGFHSFLCLSSSTRRATCWRGTSGDLARNHACQPPDPGVRAMTRASAPVMRLALPISGGAHGRWLRSMIANATRRFFARPSSVRFVAMGRLFRSPRPGGWPPRCAPPASARPPRLDGG